MTFDVQFFGYGFALVIAGWTIGQVIAIIINVIRKVGQI